MIKFINKDTGNVYMAEKPYIHWFPGAQSTYLIHTMPIMFISDDKELKVELNSDIFSLLDINLAFKEENDISLNNVKYTDINKLKVTEMTSIGEEYTLTTTPYYIHIIYISATSTMIAECIESLYIDDVEYLIGADFYSESENLEILMRNQGINIPKAVQRAIYPTNVREEGNDSIILNRKFKELLSNYWDLIANKGSYKSLINSIKWFEWGNLVKLNELWVKNDWGKTRYEERSLTDFLADKYKNSIYGFAKTTLITLRVALQEIHTLDYLDINQDEYDENGNPVLHDIATKWSKKDLILKLALLANFYETYFMPIHTHLYQATIEDIVFANNFQTYLDSATHKEEYVFDVNDFECIVNDNKPIYVTNVEVGVDENTLFANHCTLPFIEGYELSEKNKKYDKRYDEHIIVGVKDISDVQVEEHPTDDIETQKRIRDLFVQRYSGMGALVPMKCIIDTGKVQDFVKYEQIMINLDKDGVIKESIDTSQGDYFEENEYVEGEESEEETTQEEYIVNYIVLDDHKIYTSKYDEETGHYLIEIDFNILCKNHSQDYVNMTLRFDTAGGQSFVKKVSFKIIDYTNVSLGFYRVEHKQYDDWSNELKQEPDYTDKSPTQLSEKHWRGDICNNYILSIDNKYHDASFADKDTDGSIFAEFKSSKYQQFLPVKSPELYEVLEYGDPIYKMVYSDLRELEETDVTQDFKMTCEKSPYSISLKNDKKSLTHTAEIFIPIKKSALRINRNFKCSFDLLAYFTDNVELPVLKCYVTDINKSWNYVGSYEGEAHAQNIVSNTITPNHIAFEGDINNTALDQDIYLMLQLESLDDEFVLDKIEISNIDIDTHIGGLYLNNVVVLNNMNKLIMQTDVKEYLDGFMKDNYFITTKEIKDDAGNVVKSYDIGVSNKFWFDSNEEWKNKKFKTLSSDKVANAYCIEYEMENGMMVPVQKNITLPDSFNDKVVIMLDMYDTKEVHFTTKIKYFALNNSSFEIWSNHENNAPLLVEMNISFDGTILDNGRFLATDLGMNQRAIFNIGKLASTIVDMDADSDLDVTISIKSGYQIWGFEIKNATETTAYDTLKSYDVVYRNDLGYFPEFHELIPFGVTDGERSELEDEYIVRDNDVLCVIPTIDYHGKSIPFKYSNALSNGSTWEFKNNVTGKVYKYDHIQQPYILGDDGDLEPGYYGVNFKYTLTDTSKINEIKYGSVFIKK